eukprot:TRINITY_DN18817_c0_g1_i1.p1 TRINITY_DN18817_c0_g1~~TRINITY_DN18817_c0_g1_i1.p1  ORF type:complete len:198 (-),score=42.96 TRINITY_DN18817_c0_g1_i1:67-660(-)
MEFYFNKNEYDIQITEEKINISFTFDVPVLGINKIPVSISPDQAQFKKKLSIVNDLAQLNQYSEFAQILSLYDNQFESQKDQNKEINQENFHQYLMDINKNIDQEQTYFALKEEFYKSKDTYRQKISQTAKIDQEIHKFIQQLSLLNDQQIKQISQQQIQIKQVFQLEEFMTYINFFYNYFKEKIKIKYYLNQNKNQ